MRSIWTGSVSFGLINIPVKIYSATTSRRLDFDLLRKSDLSPVGYKRVAKTSGEEVNYKDLVRGYEYKRGQYVVLTDEDFKKVDVVKTNAIEIEDFVNEDEIESKYFEKPYYIEPVKGAQKVYALFCEALKKSKKAGVGRYVLRNKEHLGIVKAEGDLILLVQIRFSHEIRKPEGLEIPSDRKITEKELSLAIRLIDELTERYDPNKYQDTYTEALMRIIEEKAQGKELETPPSEAPQPTKVRDLVSELQKSLEEIQNRRYAQ